MTEKQTTDAPEAKPGASTDDKRDGFNAGISVEDAYNVHEADHREPLQPERDRSNVYGGDEETDFEAAKTAAKEGQAAAKEAEKAEAAERAKAEKDKDSEDK